MTAREFLNDVVRPNVVEFHSNYASVRHAFNAIASVDALAAHILDDCRYSKLSAFKDDTSYRDDLAGRDATFKLLRDIAKAQKHVHLDRGRPIVKLASQVASRPIGYGEGGYGDGRFGGPRQVVVDVAPDAFEYVESLADESLAFLEAEMATLGL